MQQVSFKASSDRRYVRDRRWGEVLHPAVKWAYWLFLMILIILLAGGYTGAVPQYLQPTLLRILVPLLVILGVIVIVGFFKSFDRSAWIVLITAMALVFSIGILSLLLT